MKRTMIVVVCWEMLNLCCLSGVVRGDDQPTQPSFEQYYEPVEIENHQSIAASDIFLYKENYTQYALRGHYTRSEDLERYFKAMMWYGRMAFLLKGSDDGDALVSVQDARIQTIQALELAQVLRDVQVDQRTGLEIWDRLYTVTAFYVGLADDLTPYDYLWALGS